MLKKLIAQLLMLTASAITLSAYPLNAQGGEIEALKKFNDYLCDNNAEIQFLKAELSSFEFEARAASKRSPVMVEVEGERSLESGAEKKIQAKNIAFSKSFGINDQSGLIKKLNSLGFKIKYEQTLKAIEDIIYDSYAALINTRKMVYQKKLAEANLEIAANIIDAVTRKYEVALGSKMEIEQAALDYEVQFLNLIGITGGLKNLKAELEIKNGAAITGMYNDIFNSFSTSELTSEVKLLLKTADKPLPGAGVFYSAAVNFRRDLKAVSYEIELTSASIESQKRSQAPEFNFAIFRSINDLNETERGVKLSVSMPVYDFGRRSDSLKAARLKLSGYRFAESVKSFLLEHTQKAIMLDVTEKYNLCLRNHEKLIRLSNSAFQKAASLLNMAAIGYAEGATTLLEYQNAKKSYFEFYEQMIFAALDFDLSLLELRRSCGMAPEENYDIIKKYIQL